MRFRSPDRNRRAAVLRMVRHRPGRHPEHLPAQVIFCVQGVSSPLVANIYLHYALDQWVEAWRRKVAKGDVVIVRYADDFVMGFQERAEAERFLEELRERLRKFGLELHREKTRLIAFGRKPENDWRWKGGSNPGTFDFLGFTHSCGRNRKGYFTVRRETAGKRMRARLASSQTATPDSDARTCSGHWEVAEIGRTGLLQLPCGTGK